MDERPVWLSAAIKDMKKTQRPAWLQEAINELATVGPTFQGRSEGEVTAPIDYNSAPRGIRNNNPGNVEATQPWQGMAKAEERLPSQRKETRFAVFTTPEFGIRAMGKVLQTYKNKYGINTVSGIINRWAPPFENDTRAYTNAVAKAIGVGKDDTIDLSNPKVLQPLLAAIIRHENGTQPYSSEQIATGIGLVFNNGEV